MPERPPLRNQLVSRRVGDTLIVLHAPTSRIFELNPAAAVLWDAVLAGSSAQVLERLLVGRFGVAPERAVADVAAFLAALADDDLVAPES
jgi:coenzyme PQQ synthesis protein D (PqqD)